MRKIYAFLVGGLLLFGMWGCTSTRQIAMTKIDGGSRVSPEKPSSEKDTCLRYLAGTGYKKIEQSISGNVVTLTAAQEPESPETKINIQIVIFPNGEGSESFMTITENYFREACDKTTNFGFVLNGKCEWFRYGTKTIKDDRKFYMSVFEGIDAVKAEMQARQEEDEQKGEIAVLTTSQ